MASRKGYRFYNYPQHPTPNTLGNNPTFRKIDTAYIIDLREKKIWSAVA